MVATGSSVDTLSVRPRSDSSPLVRSNSSFNPNPLRCFVQTCCKLFQCGLTIVVAAGRVNSSVRRSEEHTSELQSLMRISYAVFCLKKKTQQPEIKNHSN